MKHLTCLFLVICAMVCVSSCKKDNNEDIKLRVICEEFRPYSFMENGELKGITVDIVSGIMDLAGIADKTVEVNNDWESDLETAINSDNVVLFTTVLTTDRKDKLQWVGPVMICATGFLGLESGNLSVSGINEAMELPSVAVVTGYSTTETLENLGFGNLVYFNTMNEAIAALFDGTVSTLFDLTQPVRSIAAADGFDVNLLEDVFNYSTVQGYLAFSNGVPAHQVELWQDKLDQLKNQGFVQNIYNHYLPSQIAPGIITIYTEENPPQNYRDENGSLTGSSVEIAQAIMQVTGKEELITLTTWTDAYEQVLLNPNSMIFSIIKNDEREPLFEWIGPVCKKNYCFVVKSDSQIDLNVIDDAKLLDVVGVPEGWAAEDQLIEQGFTNLQTWSTAENVFTALMNGLADAVVLNDIAISYLAQECGYDPENVRNELVFSPGQTYFAFCKSTKSAYVDEWLQAYNTIMNNGTFAGIWNSWYPDIIW